MGSQPEVLAVSSPAGLLRTLIQFVSSEGVVKVDVADHLAEFGLENVRKHRANRP